MTTTQHTPDVDRPTAAARVGRGAAAALWCVVAVLGLGASALLVVSPVGGRDLAQQIVLAGLGAFAVATVLQTALQRRS